MSLNLSKHILATIVYYDVLDYPLTSFEIWKYLTCMKTDEEEEKFSLEETLSELESEKLSKFIESFNGFYFLKGRQDLVQQRLERNKIAESKFKTLSRVNFWLRLIPFVRMVAVTGRMAMKNTENQSDIDLLVVFKKGKIFIGRFFLTAFIQVIGKRRYSQKIANRMCLNYFITDESLEINLKDAFSASEYSFIFPIFGFKTFRKFQEANQWIKKYKPNFEVDDQPNLKLISDNVFTKTLRKIGEIVFSANIIEKKLEDWQKKKIAKNPKTSQAGSIIIASDEMLVFLPEPQSPKVYDRFKEKLKSLS